MLDMVVRFDHLTSQDRLNQAGLLPDQDLLLLRSGVHTAGKDSFS